MSERLIEFACSTWQGPVAAEAALQATEALENGKVLYLPHLAFTLDPSEQRYLSASIATPKAKNIRYDIRSDTLGGTALPADEHVGLQAMLRRFADHSRLLVEHWLPHYRASITQARTSFRPVEALGRPASYRKDDTRLHVDAFPATPTAGKRLLRVFSNVNPAGVPRHWRVGEPLSQVVERFLPRLPKPKPFVASGLHLLGLTRGKRSAYDHYMLHLHNAMKADLQYQKQASQEDVYFPAGATWLVFSDQVSHAAMSGQFMFEQTFYLPADKMLDEQRSPLRILERAVGRPLLE